MHLYCTHMNADCYANVNGYISRANMPLKAILILQTFPLYSLH